MSPPSLPPDLKLPPPPIDPTALPPYITSERTMQAISGGYSYTYNRRNREDCWYSPHQLSWSDVTDFEFSGTMHVRQQFSLWLSNAELQQLALLSLADDPGDGVSDDELDLEDDELEPSDSGSDFEPSLSSTRM